MRLHTYVPTELLRYGHTQLHGYVQILSKEKGRIKRCPFLAELEIRRLILIDRRDTPADPSHDGNRHRVADRLVARPVGTLLSGLALPGDERMLIGETLQAFALERSAEGSIADDTHLIAGILSEPEGLLDGILGYRSTHHHGRIVLTHVRGQASGNLVADMAMGLRARHANDILTPVRAGGRIAPSRQASRNFCAVLGHCHALSVCAVGSSDHIPPQRQDGRRMPVRGERVCLLFRIPYRVCSGRSGVLKACARSAASSSGGKLLPLFTARLRIP